MSIDTSGYVYVLSNPAMPGIVKIGMSKHGGRIRANEIYKQGGTGISLPFKMEFEIWAEDCHSSELYVHEELDQYRINDSREFFKIDVVVAIEAVMRVIGYDFNLHVGVADYLISEEQILSAYGFDTRELSNEIYPYGPQSLLLSHAIAQHLEIEDVKKALYKYKEACEKRALKLKGRESLG